MQLLTKNFCLLLDDFLGVAGDHQLLVGSNDQSAHLCAPGSDLAHIAHGVLVLLGVGNGDTEEDMKYIADKIIKLRIFSDENDKMNLSLEDVGGSMLVISQFTLYGDCSHGRRPYFGNAMEPVSANEMYEKRVPGSIAFVPSVVGLIIASEVIKDILK